MQEYGDRTLSKVLLLGVAFVILTNPLFSQSRLLPDPSSLDRVEYTKGDCMRWDEWGTGCRKARLRFRLSRLTLHSPGRVDVVYRDPEGRWEATVRFSPSLCSPLKGDWWKCKEVSWRVGR